MSKLDELLLRRKKLNIFWDNLSDDDKTSQMNHVVSNELEKIEVEIAKSKLEEYLNIDVSFEKEVLE